MRASSGGSSRTRRASLRRLPLVGHDVPVAASTTTRAAYAAMSGSCVTSTTVMPVAPELLEQRHHLDAGARVEVAGRLVGEDHLGLADEGARDRDALLLSARELARMVIEPLAEADALERLVARCDALVRSARPA